MFNKKILACMLCINVIFLIACGAGSQMMGDEVKGEQQSQNKEIKNILYKRDNQKVYKYSVINGISQEEEASKQDIEKLQLDKLIDGRILVWQDCFEGNMMKNDIWSFEEGREADTELQMYVAGNSNVELDNGVLKITARNDSDELDNNKWTSAAINTKGNKQFCHGRIEARIKYSNIIGQIGKFMTIEQWGTSDLPCSGKIDISKQYGDDSSKYFKNYTALHYVDKIGNIIDCGPYEAHSYDNRLTDKLFHIYAIEWTPESITTYIDNNEIATFDISSPMYWKQFDTNESECNPFLLPHFLKLSLGVDNNEQYYTASPMTMEIDWVRVYAAENIIDVEDVIPVKLGIDYACNAGDASRIETSGIDWSGNVGDEIYLGAVYLPATVVDRTCEFSVDDNSIAEIDTETGVMTAKDSGIVCVTVKDMTTGMTGSRNVNISIKEE